MADNMPWQDSRGYFMLPQQREESAYYTYGTPASGRAQYAHPNLLTFLFRIEHVWGGLDSRRLGVGNISLAGGRLSSRTGATKMVCKWTSARSGPMARRRACITAIQHMTARRQRVSSN